MNYKAKAVCSVIFSYLIGFLFFLLVYSFTMDYIRIILYGGTIIFILLCVPFSSSLVNHIKSTKKRFDRPLIHALLPCLIFCICSFLVIGAVLGGLIGNNFMNYFYTSLPVTFFFGISGIAFGLAWRYWVKS